MVCAIGDIRASRGDWVPNTITPFFLRMVFSPSFASARKASSPSAFQNSSMAITMRRPSMDELLDAVEQHHHQRRANLGVVEHVRHVESQRPRFDTDRVVLAV